MDQRGPGVCWRGLSKCDRCEVRHLALFSDLELEDLLLNPLPIDDMLFAAGQPLYREGEHGASLFTIREGLVKLVQHLPNGGRRIVRLLWPGHVSGMETLLGEPYRHTAIALQSTLTCRVPCETVHHLNRRTPRLSTQILKRFGDSLQQADDWLTHLSTGSARARVARLFLRLQTDPCNPVCQMFSREDVAAMLGITPETASRVIAEFKRDRTVRQYETNRFHCDNAALSEIASH